MSGNRFIEFFSILTYCCNQLLLLSQLKLTQGSFREFRALQQRFRSIWQTECLKNYGWRFVTLYRRQGSRPSPWKRNAKKQNGCLRRPYKQLRKEAKDKGEKESYIHLNAEFQRIARRYKKAFLSDQCKETEENNKMGKTIEISSRKLEIPREHFIQRWAQ